MCKAIFRPKGAKKTRFEKAKRLNSSFILLKEKWKTSLDAFSFLQLCFRISFTFIEKQVSKKLQKVLLHLAAIIQSSRNTQTIMNSADKKFNNEAYLVDNKCKYANEMCLPVFIKDFQKIIDIFIIECSVHFSFSLLFS